MYCRINHAFFMRRLFDFYFVLRTLCAPLGFGLRVIALASSPCAPCARQLCFGLRGIALAIFCQSSRPPHSCARHFVLFSISLSVTLASPCQNNYAPEGWKERMFVLFCIVQRHSTSDPKSSKRASACPCISNPQLSS